MNVRVAGVILLACALAACDDEIPTGPTTTPGPPTTVVFSGTIARNGSASHEFTPRAGGVVTATVTALTGGSEQAIGFAIGNWFASACSLVFANDRATTGAVLSGTLSQSGPLCVRVADAGDQIPAGTTVAYTIEVVHP